MKHPSGTVNSEKRVNGEPLVLIHLFSEDFLSLPSPGIAPTPTAPSQTWICFAERCPFSVGSIIPVSFSLWELVWMIQASLPSSLSTYQGVLYSPSFMNRRGMGLLFWAIILHTIGIKYPANKYPRGFLFGIRLCLLKSLSARKCGILKMANNLYPIIREYKYFSAFLNGIQLEITNSRSLNW